MKKKLITVLITSLVMIAAMGGFLWKMNSISKDIAKKDKAATEEEKDLLSNQNGKAIDNVDSLNIIPLYTSGSKKNVVTVDYDSVSDIYDPDESAKAEETITDIKKKSSGFTPDNALWAYNPYGTNTSAMYVYFETEGKCYCRYTVSVKDSKIPDFTRTLLNSHSGNVTTEHEYQIIGLVPGQTNYITLNLYNKNDELSQTLTYSVKIPDSKTGAQTILKSSEGRSKTELTNGLYAVFGQGKKVSHKTTQIVTKKVKQNGKTVTKRVKKNVTKTSTKYAILLYDNSGVLRAEMPLDGYCGNNMEMVYDNVVYACASNKITEVNALGQVIDTFQINGYKQSGEFTYDGFGNIYVIATSLGNKATKNSKIMKIELETGDVDVALDMDTLLSAVYKDAVKKSGKVNPDWIDVNSIQVCGTNQLMISSKALSSIFKVSNVGSLLPKLNYIIGDKEIWKNYKKLKKKVLKKTKSSVSKAEATATPIVDSILDDNTKKPDAFTSQYGQNALEYTKGSGAIYLTMLNNNTGTGSTGNDSYYYQYKVNESSKKYQLVGKMKLDQTKNNGNIIKTDDVYIYCCSDKKTFSETDSAGKLIKKFSLNNSVYRVYKSDWKNFWFY